MDLRYMEMESPFGDLFVGIDEEGALVRVSFLAAFPIERVLEEMRQKGFGVVRDNSVQAHVTDQLEAYFHKELTEFNLPLNLIGTPFQIAVWEILQNIPYGQCRTYGDIAAELGKPGASRAVGLANNRNPIPIIVPCHRVIGSNGNMVGFGGGMNAKLDLLRHEGYFMI